MTEQKPSVGRVVHYVSYGTPGGEYRSECRAAIITEVATPGHVLLTEPDGQMHSSDEVVVGLAVLNPSGMFFNRASYHDAVELPPPAEGLTAHALHGGTWHWPERL